MEGAVLKAIQDGNNATRTRWQPELLIDLAKAHEDSGKLDGLKVVGLSKGSNPNKQNSSADVDIEPDDYAHVVQKSQQGLITQEIHLTAEAARDRATNALQATEDVPTGRAHGTPYSRINPTVKSMCAVLEHLPQAIVDNYCARFTELERCLKVESLKYFGPDAAVATNESTATDHLATVENPLESQIRLENTVLHNHLTAIFGTLSGIHQQMQANEDRWERCFNEIQSHQAQIMSQLVHRSLQTAFQAAAAAVGPVQEARAPGGCAQQGRQAPAPTSDRGLYGPPTNRSQHPLAGFGLQRTPPPATVELMYNQWKGRGTFAGTPMEGGFEAVEYKHKTVWRKSWDQAQKKHFNRVRDVVRIIDHLVQEKISSGTADGAEKALQAVLEECQKEYEQCNKCLAPFVKALKNTNPPQMQHN